MATKKRHRIYIDESGDHTYKNLEDDAQRYLCLNGIIVESDYYRVEFHPKLTELKQTHFPHSPDEPVILHRRDILDRRGPFVVLRDEEVRKRFNGDLIKFIESQEYRIVSVVIDKAAHIQRYGDSAYHPYHFCLAALLERCCGLLNYLNAVGDVMVEQRGRVENRLLEEAYEHIYNNGTYFRNAAFFQRALTSKRLKLKDKKANISGLQLADLLAYPCKLEVLAEYGHRTTPPHDFNRTICNSIADKYNKRFDTGAIRGYGRVFLG